MKLLTDHNADVNPCLEYDSLTPIFADVEREHEEFVGGVAHDANLAAITYSGETLISMKHAQTNNSRVVTEHCMYM